MKFEWKLIFGAAAVLAVLAVVYVVWAVFYHDLEHDVGGLVCLVFSSVAYLLLFGFLLIQTLRRHNIPRPEDREDASMADEAGKPLGFFPASSIWPVVLGVGCVFLAIGFVFGVWYWAIGGIFVVSGIIGLTTEAEQTPDLDAAEDEQRARGEFVDYPDQPPASSTSTLSSLRRDR